MNKSVISEKPSKFKMLNPQNTLSTKAYQEHSNIEEIIKSPITIAHVTNSENKLLGSNVDILFSSIITTPSLASLIPSRVSNTAVRTNINKESDSETKTASLHGPEYLINDDFASADHDVITMLAGNQDEINELDTNIQSNDSFITSKTSASNQRRAQISKRDSIIIDELRTNGTLRSIYDIIIKYYSSTITAYTISNRLFNMQPDEVLTLSTLLQLTAAKYRPGREEQSQMVQDLISLNLFSITSPRSHAYLIRKL